MMKVFIIGLHRTGTTSICSFLDSVGMRIYKFGWEEMLSPDMVVLDKFDVFAEYPIFKIYQELCRKYPGCKFILSTRRSSSEWLKSIKWLINIAKDHYPRAHSLMKEIYGYDPLSTYNKHNGEVRKFFNGRELFDVPIEYITRDLLCDFLGLPNFPHLNKGG